MIWEGWQHLFNECRESGVFDYLIAHYTATMNGSITREMDEHDRALFCDLRAQVSLLESFKNPEASII